MSNYNAIRELLKQMSGQQNVFTVPRLYVEYTGDLTTAVLLNQIVFYSDKSKRKDGFFYKTYKEWQEEVCLTERQVRYSTNKLKNMGIVETKLMKANGAPTVHYKLDYDKFVDSILTNCQNPFLQNVSIHSDDLSETLTEITTEITTENTTLKDNVAEAPSLPFETIIDYLNEQAGTSYRHTSKRTQSLIRARFNERFTVSDFKQVIDIKVAEWLNNPKMIQYLRPETLFGTKFESYLNQQPEGAVKHGNNRSGNQASTRPKSNDTSGIDW